MKQPNFEKPNNSEERIKNFVEKIGSLLVEKPDEALEKAEQIPDPEVREGVWKEFIKNEKFKKFWSNIEPLLSHEEMERLEKSFGKIILVEQIES